MGMFRINLNKDELLLLFAVKDNEIQWHYDRYYGASESEFDESTLVDIFSPLLSALGEWTRAIRNLQSQYRLISHERKTMNEWLWLAIKTWCDNVTVKWVDEHAPENWREIVKQERRRRGKE